MFPRVWKINRDYHVASQRRPLLPPIAGKWAEWGTHRSCPVAATREAETSFPACRDSLRAVCDGKAGAVMYSRRPEGLLSNKDGSKAETPLRAFHNSALYQKLVISPSVNKVEEMIRDWYLEEKHKMLYQSSKFKGCGDRVEKMPLSVYTQFSTQNL